MTTISHAHEGAAGAEQDVRRQHQTSHAPVAPGEIAVGVVIGRASEYFDFFTYGIASVLVFPSVFFPFLSPLDGILLAFTIFSFAFIARPIGTTLFMAIQRTWSRSTKLTVALFLLGTSTVSDESAFTSPVMSETGLDRSPRGLKSMVWADGG